MANETRRTNATLYTALPDEQVTMDLDAFDRRVHACGVALIHHRALPCPVGLVDPHDIHKTHPDHVGCFNGFLYKPIGRATTVFTQQGASAAKIDPGLIDGSSVIVTFPRFYDGTEKRVIVRPFDRFYLEEENLTVATWQKLARRTDQYPDRCEFPVSEAEHLLDSDGKWWTQGAHFDLVGGDIVWKSGQGPRPAQVYTIFYLYRPFWICDKLLHEIRIAPVPDVLDTNLVRVERGSMSAVLLRENVYRTQPVDALAQGDKKRQQLPPDPGDPALDF